MKPDDLALNLPATEDPSHGFARTRRVLLRTPHAELMHGAFSARLGEWTAPNRDYALEGLTGRVDGENWKFLDALFFRLHVDGRTYPLEPTGVTATPWNATHAYALPDAERLELTYCLPPAPHPRLLVRARLSAHADALLSVKPLADIRFMNDASAPHDHRARAEPNALVVERAGKRVTVSSRYALDVRPAAGRQDWFYKLGSGNREGPPPRFIGEARALFDAGELDVAFHKGVADIDVACGPASAKRVRYMLWNASETLERKTLQRLLAAHAPLLQKARSAWGEQGARALAARLACLDRFGVPHGRATLPDAGSLWFRVAWARDAGHGTRHNLGALARAKKRATATALSTLLALQKNGLVPNTLAVRARQTPAYNSLDATLECALAAFEFSREARLPALEKRALAATLASIHAFAGTGDGAAVRLDDDGLLSCPPNYGWMDAQIPVNGRQLPTRLPRAWRDELAADAARDVPACNLVETNAQWVRLLHAATTALEKTGNPARRVAELRDAAAGSFRDAFLRSEFPPHLITEDGRTAAEEAATALEALAELPASLVSVHDVERALATAEKTLFARHNGRLFGVLCKNSGERTFYGDAQYHEAVVWPRSTPALVALLLRVGREQQAEEVLLANLDHQQNEGVAFYNAELFSPDDKGGVEGSDTAPHALVPVKNPAQYWSQWTDAFAAFLARR